MIQYRNGAAAAFFDEEQPMMTATTAEDLCKALLSYPYSDGITVNFQGTLITVQRAGLITIERVQEIVARTAPGELYGEGEEETTKYLTCIDCEGMVLVALESSEGMRCLPCAAKEYRRAHDA